MGWYASHATIAWWGILWRRGSCNSCKVIRQWCSIIEQFNECMRITRHDLEVRRGCILQTRSNTTFYHNSALHRGVWSCDIVWVKTHFDIRSIIFHAVPFSAARTNFSARRYESNLWILSYLPLLAWLDHYEVIKGRSLSRSSTESFDIGSIRMWSISPEPILGDPYLVPLKISFHDELNNNFLSRQHFKDSQCDWRWLWSTNTTSCAPWDQKLNLSRQNCRLDWSWTTQLGHVRQLVANSRRFGADATRTNFNKIEPRPSRATSRQALLFPIVWVWVWWIGEFVLMVGILFSIVLQMQPIQTSKGEYPNDNQKSNILPRHVILLSRKKSFEICISGWYTTSIRQSRTSRFNRVRWSGQWYYLRVRARSDPQVGYIWSWILVFNASYWKQKVPTGMCSV